MGSSVLGNAIKSRLETAANAVYGTPIPNPNIKDDYTDAFGLAIEAFVEGGDLTPPDAPVWDPNTPIVGDTETDEFNRERPVISLLWLAPEVNPRAFYLLREKYNTQSSAWEEPTTTMLPGDELTFVDHNVYFNTQYRYTLSVESENALRTSSATKQSLTTANKPTPAQPTDKPTANAGPQQIGVAWANAQDGLLDAYEIQFRIAPADLVDNEYVIPEIPDWGAWTDLFDNYVTHFIHSPLDVSKVYQYRYRVRNLYGNVSAWNTDSHNERLTDPALPTSVVADIAPGSVTMESLDAALTNQIDGQFEFFMSASAEDPRDDPVNGWLEAEDLDHDGDVWYQVDTGLKKEFDGYTHTWGECSALKQLTIGELADIANDNILTPADKLKLKDEWTILKTQKTILDTQAYGITRLSVVDAKAELAAHYTILQTFFDDLAIGVLVDMDATTNITSFSFTPESGPAVTGGQGVRVMLDEYNAKELALTQALTGYIGEAAAQLVKSQFVNNSYMVDIAKDTIDGVTLLSHIKAQSRDKIVIFSVPSSKTSRITEMVAGDLLINTDTLRMYKYTTSWVEFTGTTPFLAAFIDQDEKRTIYNPDNLSECNAITAYKTNDLLIPSVELTISGVVFKADTLYIAIQNSTSGFVAAHWKVTIKYTDDTLAAKKAVVFNGKPTAGYSSNDVMIPQTEFVDSGVTFKAKEIYRSNVTRASGFTPADWEVATSYSALIGDLISDGVLVDSDKAQITREWLQIQGEYNSILADAILYQTTVPTLTTKYNALAAVIATMHLDDAGSTTIDPVAAETAFTEYFTARDDARRLVERLTFVSTTGRETIEALKLQAQQQSTALASNSFVSSATRTTVSNAYNAYLDAYTDLLALIDSIEADNNVTQVEMDAFQAALILYQTKYDDLQDAITTAQSEGDSTAVSVATGTGGSVVVGSVVLATTTPVALTLTATGWLRDVSLSWTRQNNLSNLKAYNLYRGTAAGGPFTKIATLAAELYVDKALPLGGTAQMPAAKTYYYRVASVLFNDSEGPLSDVVSAVVGPVVGAEMEALSVSWDKIAASAIDSTKLAQSAVQQINMAASSVNAAQLVASAVTAAAIASSAIGSQHIAISAINATHLQSAIVGTQNLVDSAITNVKIAQSAVQAINLVDSAVLASKIAASAIDASKLQDAIISNSKLVDSAITGIKIAVSAIDTTKLQDGLISAAKLAASAVTAGKIAADAVGTNELAASAVTAAEIAASAITFGKIAVSAIEAANIRAGAVGVAQLVDSAITNVKLAASAVQSINLVDNAVIASKIAASAIVSSNLQDALIDASKLAASAVTTAKIAASAVGSLQLVDSAIVAAKIAVSAIDGTKLQNSIIDTTKLAASAVQAGQIAASAVQSLNLIDGAVSTAKLAVSAVDASKLQDSIISTQKLVDSAITNVKMGASAIAAINITDSAVVAGKIAASAIIAANLQDAIVGSQALVNSAITAVKIAASAIDASKLQDSIISAAKIVDSAIVASKMAASAVQSIHLVDSAITNAKLASSAIAAANLQDSIIGTTKLVDSAITNVKMGASAIQAINIAASAIDASKLQAAIIDASKLADSAVVAGKIAAEAVGTSQLIASAINASKIADSAIVAGKLAASAVAAVNIQAGAVGVAQLVDSAITQVKLAASAVSSINLTDNAVIAGKIAASAIVSSNLQDAVISTQKLADSAVLAGKIAASAIGTLHLVDSAITSGKLTDGIVSATKLADSAVTQAKIAASAVGTSQLIDSAIVAGKIGASAVQAANVAASAISQLALQDSIISTQKLVDSAITQAKLGASAVTTINIAASAIDASKLAASAVLAVNIAASAVTAEKLKVRKHFIY